MGAECLQCPRFSRYGSMKVEWYNLKMLLNKENDTILVTKNNNQSDCCIFYFLYYIRLKVL